MIYYTADLHLGNAEIIKRSNRPFSSVEEMDDCLIRNWNDTVTEEDTVYFLGDFSNKSGPVPKQYLSKLKGQIHWIRGNHDTGLDHQEDLFEFVESVSDFLEIDDSGMHIILCHYPILHFKRGLMIHGHLHAAKLEAWEILKGLPNVLNCGVDVNNYRSVTLTELIKNNQDFYENPQKGNGSPIQNKYNHHWKPDFRPLPVKNSKETL